MNVPIAQQRTEHLPNMAQAMAQAYGSSYGSRTYDITPQLTYYSFGGTSYNALNEKLMRLHEDLDQLDKLDPTLVDRMYPDDMQWEDVGDIGNILDEFYLHADEFEQNKDHYFGQDELRDRIQHTRDRWSAYHQKITDAREEASLDVTGGSPLRGRPNPPDRVN